MQPIQPNAAKQMIQNVKGRKTCKLILKRKLNDPLEYALVDDCGVPVEGVQNFRVERIEGTTVLVLEIQVEEMEVRTGHG